MGAGFGNEPERLQLLSELQSFFDFLLSSLTTRGSGSVTVYDKSLAAYGGLIGAAEINLEELAKIRLSPQLPNSGVQDGAGWLKLSMTGPSLAVISNFATAPIVLSQLDGWSGGLTGSSNLHLLTTTANHTVKIPSGNPGNRPPIAEFVPFAYTTEARSSVGTVVRLDGTLSTDPDSEDTVMYQWFIDDKAVSTAAIADFQLGIGTHEVKLIVTDTSGELSDPYAQSVDIKDTTAPTISRVPAIINATTTTGSATVTFPLPVAYDAVDGNVAVRASRPSGSAFPLGLTTLTFTATDRAGNRATATLGINVTQGTENAQTGGALGSTAPFLANLNDQYVKAGEVRRILLKADDADNDPVTFRLLGAPPNVVIGNIDPVARQATLFIGPLSASVAPALVRIQASDNKQQNYTTEAFLVAVSIVPSDDSKVGTVGGGTTGGGTGGGRSNRPPTAVISPLPATVDATEVDGLVVQLNATLSTDPDVDSLSYVWNDNGVDIAQGAVADVKLGIGTHVLTLTVNDGRGGIGTATSTVQVNPRPLSVKSVSPGRLSPGNQTILVINGTGFAPRATVFITGVGVVTDTYFSRSETSISVSVQAFGFATQGTRDVIVTNPDGKSATLRAGLTIQ
ncbi:MAG: HYR domain-containing protein [Blastocatellia bacterium]